MTAGWGDLARDRVNVFASVDYNKRDEIAARDRAFSRSAYIPNAAGRRLRQDLGQQLPGQRLPARGGGSRRRRRRTRPTRGCQPPYSFPTSNPATAGQCRFDYASVIDIVPPSESWNVVGAGRWRFAPDHEAFVEAAWSRTESISRVSPPPVSSATILSGDPVLTMPNTPFYPTALAQQYGLAGEPLEVFWRGLELGPRTDRNTIDQSRFVAGLQGTLAGWDYSTAINWSQSKAKDDWLAGWARGSTLLPILNSGRINLFGFNTGAALAELQTALVTGTVTQAKGTMTEFDVKASRDVWQLPGGPVGLALGAVYRKEEYEYTASDVIQEGDVPGFGGSVPSVSPIDRNIWAVFAEVNLPITQTFEANVAVRYDDYQGVGRHGEPQDRVALAAGEAAAAARFGGHRLSRPQHAGAVRADRLLLHRRQLRRPAALPADREPARLQRAVHHPARRQSRPRAGALHELRRRRGVGTDAGRQHEPGLLVPQGEGHHRDGGRGIRSSPTSRRRKRRACSSATPPAARAVRPAPATCPARSTTASRPTST